MKASSDQACWVQDYLPAQEFSLSSLSSRKDVSTEELLANLFALQSETKVKKLLHSLFWNIYEYLVTPLFLILVLVQAFLACPPTNLTPKEAQHFRILRVPQLQDRVLLLLNEWILQREEDFVYGSASLFETSLVFLKFVSQDRRSLSNLSVIRLAQFKEALRKAKTKRKSLQQLALASPRKDTSFSLSKQEEAVGVANRMTQLFLETSVEELSKTIFLVDLKLFLRQSRYVFFSKRLIKPRRRSRSYEDYINRFNTFMTWLVYMVVNAKEISQRANLVIKLVRVARNLESDSNYADYEGVEHIKLALNSRSILNLKVSMKLVRLSLTAEERSWLRQAGTVGSGNHQLMTANLERTEVPSVPFLYSFVQSILVQDDRAATFRGEGPDKTINMQKVAGLNRLACIVIRLQKLPSAQIFLEKNSVYLNSELFSFLESGYPKILSLLLNTSDLSSADVETELRNTSKKRN